MISVEGDRTALCLVGLIAQRGKRVVGEGAGGFWRMRGGVARYSEEAFLGRTMVS